MRRVKTLIDPCPHFVRQATTHKHLLEMHRDTQSFKRGDRFIRYKPKGQMWCVYTLLDVPQIRGSFNTVTGAVFNALN